MRTTKQSRQRLVIKVGSGLLRAPEGGLREDVVQNIVTQLATLRQRGHDVLLVSSGAIALGLQALHQHHMPQTIAYQQAAAAIGQSHLIWTYEQLFTPLGQRVAQILLTHDDLRHRVRYLNARNTLQTLLHYGIIPIINENDTVSVAELRFGDNDTLSAMVCNLVNADLLIILTDIDGLYTADPRQDPAAELISTVHNIDADIEARAGNTTHTTGRGGMSSKIQAAKMAAANGLHTYIANGAYPDTLLRILAGDAVGTHIHAPTTSKLPSRKRWIGYALKPKGALTVDDGAKRALTAHGRSLLPSGIIDVTGNFGFGDAVYCVDTGARRFAQGLVNYSSADIQAIMGKHTSKIAHILGHKEYDEVIHRDNLALL